MTRVSKDAVITRIVAINAASEAYRVIVELFVTGLVLQPLDRALHSAVT